MKVNITITKEELIALINITNIVANIVNPKELSDGELALIKGLASTLDKDHDYSVDNNNNNNK